MKKEFDLEKALSGEHEVFIEGGEKVEQLTYFDCDGDYQLAGILNGELETWTKDGRYSRHSELGQHRLVSRPKIKEVWQPKFRGYCDFISKFTYYTKEACEEDNAQNDNFIKAVRTDNL